MAKVSKSRSIKSRQREKDAARQRKTARGSGLTALIVFAIWLSAFLMLLGVKPFYSADFLIGQSAPATVVAMTDFEAVDLPRTELSRQQAAGNVLPIFDVDYSEYDRAVQRLGSIFDLCTSLRSGGGTNDLAVGETSSQLEGLLAKSNIDVELDEIMGLVPPPEESEELLEVLSSVLKSLAARGIASAKEKNEQFQGVASGGRIAIRSSKEKIFNTEVADLLTPEQAASLAVARIRESGDYNLHARVLGSLLQPLIKPNLTFNPKLTAEERELARRQTPEKYRNIRKGEIIVSIGEIVTPQVNEYLLAHKSQLNEMSTLTSRIVRRVGQGCVLLVALIACVGLFALLRLPRSDFSASALLLMLTISILVLLSVRGLIHLSAVTRVLPTALIGTLFPLALAAMLAALLINSSVALVLGLWVSVAAAVMFDNSFLVLMEGIAVTIVAALGVSNVRKRSQVFRAGLLIGLMMMVLHVAMGIYQNQSLNSLATHSLLGLANGVICASLALFIVPPLEYLFGRTTDIRLLELSDMSHPLLRRLAIEAPGTYHHSLMEASLAQAAADEIGANALLVRVSAYFHDIGKLSKPAFFAENIKGDQNPHDDLSPNMSMLVIAAHVKEGVTLAKRHKLPQPIIDAIQQHHAAGTVKYFYHRAMREAEAGQVKGAVGGSRFDGEHFRYDCPRPHSREMTILSMADSVEAASRTLAKPTPSRIEALVDSVIDAKFKDNQLDDAALTMAEIKAVKRSFVFTIANMRHERIEYPKDEDENEDRDSRSAEPGAGESESPKPTGGAADEQGGAPKSGSDLE